MKKAKKLLSVILTICMLMTTIGAIAPINVSAVDEDVVYDGTDSVTATNQLGITANTDSDGNSVDAVTFTPNSSGIGGKATDDYVYKFEVTDAGDSSLATAATTPAWQLRTTTGTSADNVYVEFDMYLTEGAKLILDILTPKYNASSTYGDFEIHLSEDGFAGSTAQQSSGATIETLLKSLSTNEWHKVALQFPMGGKSATVYIDGTRRASYHSQLPGGGNSNAGGIKSFNFKFGGEQGSAVYIDNYRYTATTISSAVLDASNYPAAWGRELPEGQTVYVYKNHQAADEITVSSENGITYDSSSKTVTVYEGSTVSQVAEAVTNFEEVRAFTDSTYTTQIGANEAVEDGDVLVVENEYDILGFYQIATIPVPLPDPAYDDTITYDGSDQIADTNGNVFADYQLHLSEETDAVTFESNVAGIGGKATSDKIYKITANDPEDAAFGGIYVAPALAQPKEAIAHVAFDMYLTEGAKLVLDIQTHGKYSTPFGDYEIHLSENGFAGSTALNDGTVISKNAISTGEWHKVALYWNGTSKSAAIWIDGARTPYTGVTGSNTASYGLKDFKLRVAGSEGSVVYIDNLFTTNSTSTSVAFTGSYPTAWGYEADGSASRALHNHYKPEITVSGENGVTYDSSTSTVDVYEGSTASAVLDEVTNANIGKRIFTDSTYTTQLGAEDVVEEGNVLVIENAENVLNSYAITTSPAPLPDPAYGNTITYDGSNQVADTNGNVFEEYQLGLSAETDAVTFESNIVGIGGKATSDKVYKITAKDPADAAFGGIYVAPALAQPKEAIAHVAFDMYLTEGAKLVLDIQTHGKYSTPFGDYEIHLSENGFEGSTALNDGTVISKKAISTGEWHKVALYWNGTSKSAAIWIDGQRTPYTGVTGDNTAAYGLKDFKLRVAGSEGSVVYIDNLFTTNSTETSVAFTGSYPTAWGYEADGSASRALHNHYKPEIVITAGNGVSLLDDGRVKALEGKKASEVLAAIANESVEKRIFADNTYASVLADDAVVEAGAVLVIENAENAISTYPIVIGKDETTLNMGNVSSNINVKNMKTNTAASVVEALGGKQAGDKAVYYLFPADGKERLEHGGVSKYFEISVRAPEDEGSYVSGLYGFFKTEAKADDAVSSLEAFCVYPDRIEIDDVKVMDVVPGRWYNFAVEFPSDGSKTAYTYINGTKYEAELDAPCYGVRTARYFAAGANYIDNLRYGASYNSEDDTPATLVSANAGIAVVGNTVRIAEDAALTVADLKDAFTAEDSNIRFYNKADLATELDADAAVVAGETVVVVGTYNGYSVEKVIAYYDVVTGVSVDKGAFYNGTTKLNGTDYDIRYGYEKLTYKTTINSYSTADTTLTLTLSLVDSEGNKVAADVVKSITVPAGAVYELSEDIAINGLADGYKVVATIANASETLNTAELVFDADKKELHVLLIANSFGNDSFAHLNDIAKADGVILKIQNMYIGSCTLAQHYKNIMTDEKVYDPRFSGSSEKISVIDALKSDKWDVVALQAATHGSSNDLAFLDYETWTDADGKATGVTGITSREIYEGIRDVVKEYAPDATRIMHMSWGPCEDVSKTMYDGRFADEENARAALYAAQAAGYEFASSIFSTAGKGQMVPTAYAIDYALDVLGYKEHSGESAAADPEKEDTLISYPNPVDGEISLFRDETCHLTYNTHPYGRVLAGLTWYEYLTGNDATSNAYTNDYIEEDVMANLKAAAQYANTKVVAIDAEPASVVPTASISIAVSGSGTVNVAVNHEDKGEAPEVAPYEIGTTLTYTAVANDENQTFLYWKDAISGAIVSNELVFETVVGSSASYVAVFTDAAEDIYITFKSNNKIVAEGIKGSVAVPSDPYIAGYTFDGWYIGSTKAEVNLEEVSKNTTYVAGFKADETTYNVTITGANEVGGAYKYNDKVTVTPAGEEGKLFTYWTKDGNIVSYSNEYSFYVNGDTKVAANYADEKAEAEIILVMAAPVVIGTDRIGFYAERNVPEDYEIIETGILLHNAANFDLNTAGVKKGTAKKPTANIGQLTFRKANVASGETWYGKAYLIYTDGTNVYTVYSNTVSETL